ncbi:MAG: TrkA family potassium uptake protein [Gaiellales bacterium]
MPWGVMVRATLLTPVHRREGDQLVHAVVVGCGRVGSAVASRLAGEGWTVSVIDQSMESFNRLDPAFPGDRVEGHALDEDVLCHAGITRADACVVCTDGDNTNLVTAQLVQRKFGVTTTVVRVLDPARAELYARLGLRTVCPTTTAIDTLSEAALAARAEA